MDGLRNAARHGARAGMMLAAVAAAGWDGAQAETWQQRLDALEAGAPAKLEITLQPGERLEFHRHVLDYFWTTTASGRARSTYPDGRVV